MLIFPDYVPIWLPCGKRVNDNYTIGKPMQCCWTECPEKVYYDEIDICYEQHKKKLIAEMRSLGYKVNEDNWTELKDKYLAKKAEQQQQEEVESDS